MTVPRKRLASRPVAAVLWRRARGRLRPRVVFWKAIDGRHTEGDDADRFDRDEGGARPRFFARGYFVFNEAQVDGNARRELPRLPESERIARADAFFAALKIPFVFESSEACYRPYIDTVPCRRSSASSRPPVSIPLWVTNVVMPSVQPIG